MAYESVELLSGGRVIKVNTKGSGYGQNAAIGRESYASKPAFAKGGNRNNSGGIFGNDDRRFRRLKEQRKDEDSQDSHGSKSKDAKGGRQEDRNTGTGRNR
jgi:hypothetical protein